jgi:GTP cyclohydrolase II
MTENSTKVSLRQQVRIPLKNGKITADIMTFEHLSDQKEHLAIGLGDWKNIKMPIVRMHSECLTGDVFGSAKCDCGPQLNEAMERLDKEGGLILYLRQEGRGIGLYNKIDSYHLQSHGLDTFEANRKLNFPDDLRDFGVAAEMLNCLEIKEIRLLSNNPDKKIQLEKNGIKIKESLSTGVFVSDHNEDYLKAKVSHSKHKIKLT